MIQRYRSRQGSAQLVIIIVLVTVLIGGLGFVFWQRTNQASKQSSSSENSEASRDVTRKKYAAQFASSLFSMHLLLGQTPTPDQQGLDSITILENDQRAVDPSTNQPYVFNSDQANMKVGEAFFKLNATCDNKVSGSDKSGLVVDASSKSVAVNVRLESGKYACESNL